MLLKVGALLIFPALSLIPPPSPPPPLPPPKKKTCLMKKVKNNLTEIQADNTSLVSFSKVSFGLYGFLVKSLTIHNISSISITMW